MSSITPIGNFYQKIEAYKKYLQNNRPSTMTDAQFNEQVERYTIGLQQDEFKMSNKVNGREFAKNLAMEKNGTAKVIEEQKFAQALEQEKQWLEASHQSKTPQGVQVDRHSAQAIKESQLGSQLKGKIKEVSHIENLEKRAKIGNASSAKRAKIQKRADKHVENIINRIMKKLPDYQTYQDKENANKVQRRIRYPENLSIKATANKVKTPAKLPTKGKFAMAAAVLTIIGGIFYANSNKTAEKTQQINAVA